MDSIIVDCFFDSQCILCNRKVSIHLAGVDVCKYWQQPCYTPVLGSHVCQYCLLNICKKTYQFKTLC